MSIRIRKYQDSDQGQLLAILRLNIPDFFAPSEEQDFTDYLARELEDYFVAVIDNQIVGGGGINYFPENQEARISWDMIHPDFQGQGIGSRLTEHRLQRIAQSPEITIIVVRTSQFAYPYYAKFGFTITYTKKDYWAPGYDLYHMSMPGHDSSL